MKPNEGATDRIIRSILGVVLVIIGWPVLGNNTLGIISDIIGVILLITGIIGFCALYKILGINTLTVPKTDIGLTAYSTLALAILTGALLVCMVKTIFQQKGFNKKQLELYELSIAPQVFVEFDSLRTGQEYNVFYHIKNVGNSPALDLRVACQITPDKQNPFKEEITREVTGDVFPGTSHFSRSVQRFKSEGTQYLHFRVDLEDLLKHKYCYTVTYYLIFQPSEDAAGSFRYKSGYEYSEYSKLNQ